MGNDNIRYMGEHKSRHDVAAHLREIADDLEAGKVQAVAVAAVSDEGLTDDYLLLPSVRMDGLYALIGLLSTLGLLVAGDALRVHEGDDHG